MRTKLSVICVLIACSAAAPAFAENLVDRSGDDHTQTSGSIFDIFKSRGPSSGATESAGDQGCGPVLNAAGDPVYIKRAGCPRP